MHLFYKFVLRSWRFYPHIHPYPSKSPYLRMNRPCTLIQFGSPHSNFTLSMRCINILPKQWWLSQLRLPGHQQSNHQQIMKTGTWRYQTFYYNKPSIHLAIKKYIVDQCITIKYLKTTIITTPPLRFFCGSSGISLKKVSPRWSLTYHSPNWATPTRGRPQPNDNYLFGFSRFDFCIMRAYMYIV